MLRWKWQIVFWASYCRLGYRQIPHVMFVSTIRYLPNAHAPPRFQGFENNVTFLFAHRRHWKGIEGTESRAHAQTAVFCAAGSRQKCHTCRDTVHWLQLSFSFKCCISSKPSYGQWGEMAKSQPSQFRISVHFCRCQQLVHLPLRDSTTGVDKHLPEINWRYELIQKGLFRNNVILRTHRGYLQRHENWKAIPVPPPSRARKKKTAEWFFFSWHAGECSRSI